LLRLFTGSLILWRSHFFPDFYGFGLDRFDWILETPSESKQMNIKIDSLVYW